MRLGLAQTSAFAAGALVLAAYVFMLRPVEAGISERYADVDGARATLEQRLVAARRVPSLERERLRLLAAMRTLHLGDGRAATVDRLLRTIAAVSRQDGISVQSIAAGVPSPPGTAAARPPVLDELPFDVTLRGRYGDVIRAARDLNAEDGVARITLASLGNAERLRGGRPQLSAAFHIILLREANDATTSIARAR